MRPSGPSKKGRKGTPQDGSAWLPKGYSVEAEGENVLLLGRADGSAVAAYAFSAFSPTPETLREAAEEDLRRGLRRDRRDSEGANGKEGRGG